MHLWPAMVLACVLVGAGLYGVLARRNAVLVLIGLELLLNAANLLLVTFDASYGDRLHGGQVLTLFVVTVAAAEIGVALAVVLLLFRRRGDVDLLAARDLGEPNDVGHAADVRPLTGPPTGSPTGSPTGTVPR